MGSSGPAPDGARANIREFFADLEPMSTPLTVTEIVSELECSRRTARNCLEDLVASGDLQSKSLPDETRVWWRAEATDGGVDRQSTTISWQSETIDQQSEPDDQRFESDDQQSEPDDQQSESDDQQSEPDDQRSEFDASEQPLREERDLTEQLLEAVPASIALLTADGEFVRANRRMLDRIGITDAELPDYSVDAWEMYDDDGAPIPADEWPWSRAVDTGDPVHGFECQVHLPHIGRRWLSIDAVPLADDSREDDRVVVSVDDITDQRERERRLRREYNQTEKLLQTAPIAIAVRNAAGETVLANQRAQTALGLSETAILADPIDADDWDVYDTTGEPLASDEMPSARALATGEPVSDEELIVDPPDGDRLEFRVNAAPIFDEDGSVDRVITAAEDITELKARERQLEQRKTELETELNEVLDRVADAFYALDDEWRFTHVNESAADLLQRSEAALLGRSVWDVFPDATEGIYWEQFQRAMESQEPVSFEVRAEWADAWLEFNVYPSESGLSIYVHDVTERKEREQELERYETLFTESTDVNAVLNPDGTFQYLPPSVEHVLGYEPDELVGEDAFDYVHPDDRERVRADFERMIDDPDYRPTNEFRYRHADGSWIWLESAGRNLLDDPNIGGLVSYTRDITDRVERERELERTERRFEAIFEDPNILVGLLEPDGTVVDINGTAMEYINADLADVTGEPFWETPWWGEGDEVGDDVRDWVERAAANEYVDFEADLTRPDGEEYTLSGYFRPVTDDDGEVVSIIVSDRDVTERREYERALEERERELTKYETIVETINDGIYVKDEEGRFTMVNETYADLTGYDREELLGAHASLVVDEDAIEQSEALRETMADVDATDATNPTVEAMIRTADGETVPAEGTVSTVQMPDGKRKQVGVVRDITERKERQRKLEESNERLEQFAYAASHDLQEPLRMVSSYLRLIEDRYADDLDADGREFLAYAVDGADRMRHMIQGLLEYSRVDTRGDPFEPVAVDDVLAEVRDDLQMKIEEQDAEITAGSLPRVRADREQLRQLFQNLLDNAIEYSGDEPPRVHVDAERDDELWQLSVRDEGIGIDPDDTDRVFEVFESLHSLDEHQGTGIGLALCKRIVERHGGDIWIDSEPGEGSTFHLTLPPAEDE